MQKLLNGYLALVPTLRVGMQGGRSSSGEAVPKGKQGFFIQDGGIDEKNSRNHSCFHISAFDKRGRSGRAIGLG